MTKMIILWTMVFMFAEIGNIKIHVLRDNTITRKEFIVPPSLSILDLSLMLKDIFWCNHYCLRLQLNVIPREGDFHSTAETWKLDFWVHHKPVITLVLKFSSALGIPWTRCWSGSHHLRRSTTEISEA